MVSGYSALDPHYALRYHHPICSLFLPANDGTKDYVAYKSGNNWILGDANTVYPKYICEYGGGKSF